MRRIIAVAARSGPQVVALAFLTIGSTHAHAQDSIGARTLFGPVSASPFEARIGVAKALDRGIMTLAVGGAADIADTRVWKEPVRAGVEFFTWSRLQTTVEFRFPVETIDYYFGVNATWAHADDAGRWEARLRLGHISAHAVDGQYDNYRAQWATREPFTFSREFFDLMLARRARWSWGEARAVAGTLIILHSIPTPFGTFAPEWGLDVSAGEVAGHLRPYVAWFGRVQNYCRNMLVTPSPGVVVRPDYIWVATNCFEAGALIAGVGGAEVRAYAALVTGESIHGEYLDRTESDLQIGMAVTF